VLENKENFVLTARNAKLKTTHISFSGPDFTVLMSLYGNFYLVSARLSLKRHYPFLGYFKVPGILLFQVRLVQVSLRYSRLV